MIIVKINIKVSRKNRLINRGCGKKRLENPGLITVCDCCLDGGFPTFSFPNKVRIAPSTILERALKSSSFTEKLFLSLDLFLC